MTDDLLDEIKLLAGHGGPSEEATRQARERLATRMAAATPAPRSVFWERARWALAPTAAAALALVTAVSILDSSHTGRVGPRGISLPESTSTHPDDRVRRLGPPARRRPKAKAEPSEPSAPAASNPPPAASPLPGAAPAPQTTTDTQPVLPTPQRDRPESNQGAGGGGQGESPSCPPAQSPPASTTPTPPATSTPQEPPCPPASPPPTKTEPKEGSPTP